MSKPAGTVIALLRRPEKRGATVDVEEIHLETTSGVEGDHSQKPHRLITILAEEAWQEATSALGENLPWQTRRANVLVRGVDLRETVSQKLSIGSCVIEIRGETMPCQQMDDAADGLCEALKPNWRGGVYGAVIEGGTIRPGDPVSLG